MSEPIDPGRCPLCGRPNHCREADPSRPGEGCWCRHRHFPRELLERIPPHARRRACVCLDCLASALSRPTSGAPQATWSAGPPSSP